MLTKFTHRMIGAVIVVLVCLAPMAAFLIPQEAVSTTELMIELPAYSKYRCALCHTSATPATGSADLNVFGEDFLNNENIWDATLALLNSDNDKCLNGFEIGDQEGDGVYDYPGEAIEHANPGDGADCSIALTIQTWGKIKDVFSSEMPDYLQDCDLEDDCYSDWRIHFP
jgi:hypothetical protein